MPYTGRLVIRIEGTVASHCAVSAANVIASHDQIAFIAFDDGLQWNLSYFIGSASIDVLGISGAHAGWRQPAFANAPVLPCCHLRFSGSSIFCPRYGRQFDLTAAPVSTFD